MGVEPDPCIRHLPSFALVVRQVACDIEGKPQGKSARVYEFQSLFPCDGESLIPVYSNPRGIAFDLLDMLEQGIVVEPQVHAPPLPACQGGGGRIVERQLQLALALIFR